MSYLLTLVCLIPARLESSRFPDKPLAEINGVPMVNRVYGLAKSSGYFKEVYVVTPNHKIFTHCHEAGINVLPTPPSPDDCIDCAAMGAEALMKDQFIFDRYVILQGDEPLFDCRVLEDLDYSAECINLFTSTSRLADRIDDNIVKVMFDSNYNAIYFSRYYLPHVNSLTTRGIDEVHPHKQLGVYIFSLAILRKFHSLDPSFLERAEGIGLNRLIENGVPIQMQYSPHDSISVDLPSDIDKVEGILRCQTQS